MARVSTYLNFSNNTEEVFLFYRSVFGGDFEGGKDGIRRFSDLDNVPDGPPLRNEDRNLVMHVALPILGGAHVLMGSDAPESMGFQVVKGNNVYISLEPDTRKETEYLFQALSKEGEITMPLQEMFWGAYYGSCTDKFGICWMVNCSAPS